MHYVFVLRLRAENVAELVMQAVEMGGIGAESWRGPSSYSYHLFSIPQFPSPLPPHPPPARMATSWINVKPSGDSRDPTLYTYYKTVQVNLL